MERNTTIMVADDDPAALEQAASALSGAGFRVIRVPDGQQAIQEAISHRVDLIIVDVSMPQLNGVETCHCLKAMPKTSKIPVILTAAKKDPETKSLKNRSHGSVRVLRKPYDSEELLRIVRELSPNGSNRH
jgi:CheY-like chemotaxis protein